VRYDKEMERQKRILKKSKAEGEKKQILGRLGKQQ
jgi:hypothetical protein